MPYVDREGTPEHTTHPWACGCSEAREARLREEVERLRAALREAQGWADLVVRRATAALKDEP